MGTLTGPVVPIRIYFSAVHRLSTVFVRHGKVTMLPPQPFTRVRFVTPICVPVTGFFLRLKNDVYEFLRLLFSLGSPKLHLGNR